MVGYLLRDRVPALRDNTGRTNPVGREPLAVERVAPCEELGDRSNESNGVLETPLE